MVMTTLEQIRRIRIYNKPNRKTIQVKNLKRDLKRKILKILVLKRRSK